jgi:hypothetical protein
MSVLDAQIVHGRPQPGLSFTPCCDRTLMELSPLQRISNDPEQVTCNRLSLTDELVLTGRPFVTVRQNSEQLVFTMAVSVRTLCGPALSLQSAFEYVRAAVVELVPSRDPQEFWSAALMVRITSRATELAGL